MNQDGAEVSINAAALAEVAAPGAVDDANKSWLQVCEYFLYPATYSFWVMVVDIGAT